MITWTIADTFCIRGKFGAAKNRACRSVGVYLHIECHKEKDVKAPG